MLFKIFLVLIMLITITLIVNDYFNRFVGKASEVIEINDIDIAKANDEINDKGEILINDTDISDEQIAIQTRGESKSEIRQNQDGSTTIFSVDGFGNKTETKEFNNHSRLKRIMVQTSVKGEVKVYVYGQNGKVESVPPELYDKVLTISPEQVANAAGIYETKYDRERKKAERKQAKLDRRKRKSEMTEFNISRENLPDPVYPEYDRKEDQNSDSSQKSKTTDHKREQISDNKTPNEEK